MRISAALHTTVIHNTVTQMRVCVCMYVYICVCMCVYRKKFVIAPTNSADFCVGQSDRILYGFIFGMCDVCFGFGFGFGFGFVFWVKESRTSCFHKLCIFLSLTVAHNDL